MRVRVSSGVGMGCSGFSDRWGRLPVAVPEPGKSGDARLPGAKAFADRRRDRGDVPCADADRRRCPGTSLRPCPGKRLPSPRLTYVVGVHLRIFRNTCGTWSVHGLSPLPAAHLPSLSASLDYARRECAAAPATIELLIDGFYADRASGKWVEREAASRFRRRAASSRRSRKRGGRTL